MSRRVRFPLLFLVATTSLVGLNGCAKGPDDSGPPPPPTTSTGGKSGGSGTGGKTGSGGDSSSTGSGGSAPSSSNGGSGGGSAPAGTGGSGGGAPTGTGGTTTPTDGGSTPESGGGTTDMAPPASGDWMGYAGVPDLSQVVPTAGCGKPSELAPGTWKFFDIANIPVPKDQRDNAGDGTRRYYVRLPPNYNPDTKYKVIISASSCTGGNQSLQAMNNVDKDTDAAGGVILISPIVEPGVWDQDQCYDDKDPHSIEHPFLERFLAQVGEKACYDKNKVFVQGHSSGGWYSNLVGWTWTTNLIRGIASNGGGLPDDSTQRPILNGKPMAGMWIQPLSDDEQPLAARRAVSRALVVNKCEGAGTNPDDMNVHMTAPSTVWNEGGAIGCKKYKCPAAFPVIFCTPPGSHQPISWHTKAAWAMFNAIP
jgi:poly(3-hydroxybutyrate) depolymerase